MNAPSPRTRRIVLGAAVVLVVAAFVAVERRYRAEDERCGPGFVARGVRCCGAGDVVQGEICGVPTLSSGDSTSDHASVVAIPRTELDVGPSDWEAEGRVPRRHVVVEAFRIDAFEVTVGAIRCATCATRFAEELRLGDRKRAAYAVTYDEARAHCASVGGRLPTEDEWIAAAAGPRANRYPWGESGAVCRRAVWGLVTGPCGTGARGPDSVGSRKEGATENGLFDLAGNVAEWVEPNRGGTVSEASPTALGVVRGGSFQTSLVTDLRTWSRREMAKDNRDPSVGVRCAYDRSDARDAATDAPGDGIRSIVP
ncbi:MAG: formylglycine-generating enzyme family protein [Polyangiaceae bacterium]